MDVMDTIEEIEKQYSEYLSYLKEQERHLKIPTKNLFVEDDDLISLLEDIKEKDIDFTEKK